ncbi:DUF6507 family protein [Kocuria sp.]|uniref:DUF6507 family protein n=1 Tax=Kocuria sp. TaxID=1871328 RepID=UPI0026DF7B90|nr:DUF6507 family protein [Kocuria sp.]MDO5617152.1 hypothetical protein [Kocuria sp.]
MAGNRGRHVDKASDVIDDIRAACQHQDLKTALDALRDDSLLPGMTSVVNRIASAAYFGSQAITAISEGDQDMAGQAQMYAGHIVVPDMPGVVNN